MFNTRKNLVVILFFIFFISLLTIGYAEVTLVPSDESLEIMAKGGSVILDTTKEAEVEDSMSSGKLLISYNASSKVVTVTATKGKSSFTYSIAKFYLDPEQSVTIYPTNNYRNVRIVNNSKTYIVIDYPGNYTSEVYPQSEIMLFKLADNNFHLKQIKGKVIIVDSKGRRKDLSLSGGVNIKIIQGYGEVPYWRQHIKDPVPSTA